MPAPSTHAPATADALVEPALFWFWNATPSQDGIRRQLDLFALKGIRAVYIHPMPNDFEPGFLHGGMDTPYLSDAFFDWVAFTCDEMKRRDQFLWLYDEGGWPSGVAGGAVVATNPAFGLWTLTRHGDRIEPGQLLPDCSYPDLTNPDATACFIRTTHERYHAAIGHEFGRTVLGIFTDEPRLTGRMGTATVPWSPRLPAAFEADHGMPLANVVRDLFTPDPPTPAARETRRKYIATLSRLITDGYYRPIREWCDRHDLLFEGHHSGEDAFSRHSQYFGHFMQQAAQYHIPGVDTIWRMIFPGQPGGNFVGLASSVAWLRGDRVAVSESFNVYGAGLTLEQMRWIAGYQIVRGVNKIGIMPSLYATAGSRRISSCADISPRNPIWRDFDLLVDHLRRAAKFSLRGTPHPAVGVFYRTELMNAADEAAFDERHERVCEAVHNQMAGLVFVDVEALERVCPPPGQEPDPFALSALVIHVGSPLTDNEWAALRRAVERGLHVVWVANKPGWRELLTHLGPEVEPGLVQWAPQPEAIELSSHSPIACVPKQRGVRLLTLHDGQATRFLFFNQNPDAIELAFELRHPTSGECLAEQALGDDVTCQTHPLVERGAGFRLHLEPGQMRALTTTAEPKGLAAAPLSPPPPVEIRINRCWEIIETQEFVIQDDIRIRRIQRPSNSDKLADYSAGRPAFSGSLVYRTSFEFTCGKDRMVVLDLGQVCYSAEVLVNGRTCGRRAWSPYVFDVTAALREGLNDCQVRVTNTLANQWARPDVRERDFRLWHNPYLERSRPFTDESCHAGLLGPILLRSYPGRPGSTVGGKA